MHPNLNTAGHPDDGLILLAAQIYSIGWNHMGFPPGVLPRNLWMNWLIPSFHRIRTTETATMPTRHCEADFPSWEEVRDAPEGDVIDAIRPAGLAPKKGPRIQAILRQITEEKGNLDPGFLREIPPEEARAWLLKFNGVGPKTAAIVMQFSLATDAFPVDTHIYRVTGRLGLRPAAMTREAAHGWLEKVFDPRVYGPAHLNLIRLGRETCHPRKPDCAICPVRTSVPIIQPNG